MKFFLELFTPETWLAFRGQGNHIRDTNRVCCVYVADRLHTMTTKAIPWYVWLIPMAFLMIATARLPYGYYTFTRMIVCAAAVLFAFASWNEGQVGKAFAVVLMLVAALFNPIIPIHLNRKTWASLDIATAAIFAIHLLFVRLRKSSN